VEGTSICCNKLVRKPVVRIGKTSGLPVNAESDGELKTQKSSVAYGAADIQKNFFQRFAVCPKRREKR